VTLPYLRSRGVNRLDGLFLTHGDAQHIGAAFNLFADLHPRTVYDSPVKDRSSTRKKLHAELGALGRGEAFLQQGDTIAMGGATLRVLFPPAGLTRNAADDKALVIMLECEGRRILLTSDAGFATEQWLMEWAGDLKADVLIKGQHARDISGTAEFLDRVQPAAIVVSSDQLRRPNDAFASWAEALQSRGIALFRQDECGAVKLEIGKGGGLRLSGFANAQTFTSRAR
jgi:competence protein ComEC